MFGLTIDSPRAIRRRINIQLNSSAADLLQLAVGGEAAYIIYYLLHHQLTITIAVAAYDV